MQSETGLQLLARLGSRPSISDVLSPIFKEGPNSKDVIELYGPEGTGKTEILLNIVAHTILPKSWKSVPLNGKDASVIFIDNDYKFSILRLVALMESRINMILKNLDQHEHTTNDVEMLIQKCLSRLSLIRCSSSAELLVTLYSLEQTILSNPNLAVIMIDSISAFYWIDKCNCGESLSAQERNMRLITEVLSQFVNDFSLIVIATKCELFKKKTPKEDSYSETPSNTVPDKMDHQEFLCKPWGQLVTQRYILEKQSAKKTFKCQIEISKNNISVIKFKITENGIQYVPGNS
ncbi:DNA repair protein XRCC2-like [Saccostrea echinata]|uniref:DNA repair protein XRCC2-like n=1 Tax=Saccostrea echinata TaxID=191078 RepID=UPI002A8057BC|nr:DNA repair protein XRCC2-like [Saccostrea echinata]